MFYPPDDEVEAEVAIAQPRKQPRPRDSFTMTLGLTPEQLAEQDCLTNFRENATISTELKQKLCKIINGVLINPGDNHDISKKDLLGELMHIWYNDNLVVSEIYDTLRQNGLHITKEINMNVEQMKEADRIFIGANGDTGIKTENDNEVYYYYYLRDYKSSTLKFFNARVFEEFKDIEIDKYLLNDQLFAIPFGIGGYLGDHANMLIIKQYNDEKYDKPVIECEHFEPHGQYYMAEMDKEKSNFIINRVFEFIHLLFDPKKYKIIILNPNQICPTVELQGLTSNEWGGSCTVFAMWYMFLRLLNPTRSRSETYHLMNNFLKSSRSANDIIRQIVATFTSLVSIDLTAFTVNGTPLTPPKREALAQHIFPNGFPTEGGRMNPAKPTRKKKKFKTVKKRNKKYDKTRKIINSKRRKTKIKRKHYS